MALSEMWWIVGPSMLTHDDDSCVSSLRAVTQVARVGSRVYRDDYGKAASEPAYLVAQSKSGRKYLVRVTR
jgi:hypothetical protein